MSINVIPLAVVSNEEVLKEPGLFIVRRAKPDEEPPLPGSIKIKCSGCQHDCWIAPSGQQLQEQDKEGKMPPICMDCALQLIGAEAS